MVSYVAGILTHMDPQNMVYVDINSIMQSNAKILEQWHKKYGINKSKVNYYKTIANNLMEAIDKVKELDTITKNVFY